MIVDLDVLNIGKLFEVLRDRARDGIERAVGLTCAGEVNMRHAIGIFEFAIAGEAIEHEGKSLVAFNADRTMNGVIEHGANDVPR